MNATELRCRFGIVKGFGGVGAADTDASLLQQSAGECKRQNHHHCAGDASLHPTQQFGPFFKAVGIHG